MEQRPETRVTVRFEAKVTNLRQPERSEWGEVSEVQDYRACLTTEARLEPGDVLQLEMADSIVTSQVVSCHVEGARSRAQIEIQRVEGRDTGLAHLLEQTLKDRILDQGPVPASRERASNEKAPGQLERDYTSV